MLVTAEGISKKYHQGQKYGNIPYFEGHIVPVVDYVDLLLSSLGKRVKWDSLFAEKARTVAFLHDILEDTECSPLRLTLTFPYDVVEAVKLLTKGLVKNQTLDEYLGEIKNNPLALIVKTADILVNISTCYVGETYDYKKARDYYKPMLDFLYKNS